MQSFEALNQRAVAVVVDPIQSVKGKVVIDAFRCLTFSPAPFLLWCWLGSICTGLHYSNCLHHMQTCIVAAGKLLGCVTVL